MASAEETESSAGGGGGEADGEGEGDGDGDAADADAAAAPTPGHPGPLTRREAGHTAGRRSLQASCGDHPHRRVPTGEPTNAIAAPTQRREDDGGVGGAGGRGCAEYQGGVFARECPPRPVRLRFPHPPIRAALLTIAGEHWVPHRSAQWSGGSAWVGSTPRHAMRPAPPVARYRDTRSGFPHTADGARQGRPRATGAHPTGCQPRHVGCAPISSCPPPFVIFPFGGAWSRPPGLVAASWHSVAGRTLLSGGYVLDPAASRSL